ncbi:hypothetical protein Tco_0313361, partial [Tanacetum coccineum]
SKKTWYSVPRDVDAASDVYGSSSSKSIPLLTYVEGREDPDSLAANLANMTSN